ncbi:MAG: Hpt domain-containing protein, partial [Gammaproteobacteria bacterium]|nr:Hpt domain-containing protein [Gammaproteobacteria bacterium]
MSTADNLVDTLGEGTDPLTSIAAIAKELSEFLIRHRRKRSKLIPSYLEYVTRIAESAIKSGCMSLHDICILYQERLNALVEGGGKIGEKEQQALTSWPDLIQAFVGSAPSQETGNALVEHLNLPCWNSRLSDIDAEVLKTMLSVSDTTASGSQENHSGSMGESDRVAVPVSSVKVRGELPAGVQELVDILIAGVTDMENQLQATLKIATDVNASPKERSTVLDTFVHQLGNFDEAASSIGFSGLKQVCSHIQSNLASLRGEQIKPEVAAVLTRWIANVRTYLKDITDPDAAATLAVVLVDPAWTQPLTGDAAESLSLLLVTPELPGFEAGNDKQQLQASPEDVSLELPDDVDPELLEALLQELPGQTESFSAAIQNLNNGGSLEDINFAQRVAHTLKGAGNTVGVRGVANIAHRLEDILLALAKHETLPPKPLAEMMLNAADCLAAMSEALAGIGRAPSNALEVLQTIYDWADQIDRDGIPADVKPPERSKTTGTDASNASSKQDVTATDDDQQESAKVAEAMLRIPAALVDDLLRIVGETVIMTGQIHERLRRITQQSRDIQDQYSSIQQLGAKLEELIDVKDMSALYQKQQRDHDFDPLEMDQYSELHTCTRRLIEAVADIHVMGRGVMDQLRFLDDMVAGQVRL